MYNENDNQNNQSGNSNGSQYGDRRWAETNMDQDVDYTEGAYSDGASARENRSYVRYTQSQEGGNAYSGNGSFAGGQGGGYGGGNSGRPDSGYIPDGPKRGRGGAGNWAKRAAGIVAAGILFGCVAGGTMAGVNLLTERAVSKPANASSQVQDQTQETIAQTQAALETAKGAAVSASTGNDVSAIVEAAMPSVVALNNKMIYTQEDWFFGTQQFAVPSSGSGIIAGQNDSELLIVTNNHVVQDSEQLSVTFIDDTSVNAAVKGTDSESDLAVIAVQLSDIPEETRAKIKPATLGDSDQMKLGQGVVAIGNALGEGQAVTVGYVSALNKKVTIDGVERTLLQVDAAINPGNSGGALLNMQGEVIGINAAKYSKTEVEGIGYAIPISFAKDIIQDLMNKTTKVEVAEEEQGYLGIQLQNIDSRMANAYGMPVGIYVYKIVEGGAAANSGLRERDIITKFDGETVRTGDDLQKMLTYYKGGTTVTLTVQSLENGSYVERTVDVTLGFKKDSQKAGNNQGGNLLEQQEPQNQSRN